MHATQVLVALASMMALIACTAVAREASDSGVEKLVPGLEISAAGFGCEREGGSTTGST